MANVYPDDRADEHLSIWVRPRSNERPRIKVCAVHRPRMLPVQTATMTLERTIPAMG